MKKNDFLGMLAFICLMFVSTVVNAQTVAVEPADRVAGSGGTINNLAELRWVSENDIAWSEAWTLMADIDASETETWSSGEGFQPMGTDALPFSGSFNGNFHVISDIFINRPANDRVGFFGDVAGTFVTVEGTDVTDVAAEISNLGLINVNITGQTEQGGLASRIKDASVTMCFVHGGSVQASDLIATGGMTAGGLIGRLDMRIVVEDCYASCDVTAKFAGVFGGAMSSSGKVPWDVNRCYAAGLPTGTYIGGVGSMLQGGNFTSVYYDNTIYNGAAFGRDMQAGDEDITALGTAAFATQGNFPGWDFDSTWEIKTIDGQTRPYLKWHIQQPTKANEPADRVAGTGGTINNLAELRWVSENDIAWSEAWTLMADIDASESETWNSGEGFQPMGTDALPFSGSFNGNFHVISDIFINRPANDRVGFFGDVAGTFVTVEGTDVTDVAAEISNLGLINVNITGQTEQGGLASRIKDASVTMCFVHGGSVQASDLLATGGMTAGGFIGRIDMRIVVEDCYASCDVTAKFAGVFGGAMSSSGKVPWDVNRCYAAGLPTGTYIGGVGSMLQGGNFTSVYYDNTIYNGAAFGRDMQAGDEDITALGTAAFATQGNFPGWDFDSTWEIKTIDGQTRPFFKWQDGDTPTSIDDLGKEENSTSVYPNPATDYFIINSTEARVKLQVFSLSGHKVIERMVNTKTPIDVSSFTNGVYIIRINNYTQKLIIK